MTKAAPQIRVRSAVPADAHAIHAIIDQCAASGSVLPRAVEDIDLWIETFVVGVINDTPVACASLTVRGDPSVGEIRSVAVSEAARGTGLGKAIILYLIDEAHSIGLERLFLLTRIPGFFERCGFRTIHPEELPDSFLADLMHVQRRSLFNKIVMTRPIDMISGFADAPTLDRSPSRAPAHEPARRAHKQHTETKPAGPRHAERVA